MNIYPEKHQLYKINLSTDIMTYDQVSCFVNDSISSTNLSDINDNEISNYSTFTDVSCIVSSMIDEKVLTLMNEEI